MTKYHKIFLYSISIVFGITETAVLVDFLIEKNESIVFIVLFSVAMAPICFGVGFIVAELCWKTGKRVGTIAEND